VKIRILAQAGVPLARIKDLLTADPDQFTAAVADIDRSLRERADAIHDARRRLAQLVSGEKTFVPTEVAGYLDRLRDSA
jgi:DNA-binding transcriptional MerR regulator